MNPRILVLGPERLDDYLRPYCEALHQVGAEPVRAWFASETPSDVAGLQRFVESYHGLVLPGGPDVEPWRYGEKPHRRLGRTDPELDEGHLAMAGFALRSSLPTLAICRGIQVIAVAARAALYQDLPSQRPSAVAHRAPKPRDALAHEVEVERDSRLAALCGSRRFPVNSRHHQAAREGETAGWVGSLRVVARAPDGVVEGLEDPDHPFLVAVQWHPENLVEARPEARDLFSGFVAACRHATCYEGGSHRRC